MNKYFFLKKQPNLFKPASTILVTYLTSPIHLTNQILSLMNIFTQFNTALLGNRFLNKQSENKNKGIALQILTSIKEISLSS